MGPLLGHFHRIDETLARIGGSLATNAALVGSARSVATTLLVLALPLCSTGAQQSERAVPMEPGARVRVSAAGGGRHTGTLLSSGDTLVLLERHGDSVRIASSMVTRLEVSRGRETKRARDALIGLGVGAIAGLAIGASSQTTGCTPRDALCDALVDDLVRGPSMAAGAAVFGGLGALAGALVGSRSRDRWAPVPLGTLRGALAPGRRGAGGGVRLVVSLVR